MMEKGVHILLICQHRRMSSFYIEQETQLAVVDGVGWCYDDIKEKDEVDEALYKIPHAAIFVLSKCSGRNRLIRITKEDRVDQLVYCNKYPDHISPDTLHRSPLLYSFI